MIRPLEYSSAPLQMISQLASSMQQERLLKEKQYQEEFAQGAQLAQMITPQVLNKNFDAEVVDSSIADMRNSLRDYIRKNPNANSAQIQSEVQRQIGGISEWSNRVKAIKANIEETFKQMGQDKKVNKDRWMNAALTKALYKTNQDGSKSIKSLLELERDPSYNYAADVWNTGGEAFIDISQISKDLEDSIKNSAKNKQNVTVAVGATKNKPGFTRTDNIEIPVWAEWDATNNKVTVKKKNGVIDNEVYGFFVRGPEYDKFLNIKTKSALASGGNLGVKVEDVFDEQGNIKDQSKFETAKKNWLTSYLEKFAPVTQTEKEVTQPARVDVVVNQGTQTKKSPGQDFIERVMTISQTGDVAQLAETLYEMRVGNGRLELTNAKVANDKSGFTLEYNEKDDRTGQLVKKSKSLQLNDPNFAIELARIYQQTTGNDAKLEKSFLTGMKDKYDQPKIKKYNPKTGKYE